MQQKPQKKVPVRRCVGCNTQKPKKELVRIVRSPEGEVSVDLTGKRSGRGAYLCPSAACLAKARKAKRLEHAFGVPVLGVIYVPVRKELYFASSSVGAYKFTGIDSSSQPSMDEMKQRAIHLPMALAHQGVVVVASRSHQTEETTAFIDNLRKQGKPVTLISSGSSLKICLVAEGSADIYPRFAPTMEWDTAAGHAIAKSAGCDIYHIDGKTPLRYNKEDLHNPWFIVK